MRVYVHSFVLCLASVGYLAAQQPAPGLPAPPVPPEAPQPARGPYAAPFKLAYEGPRAGGSYLGVGLAEIDAPPGDLDVAERDTPGVWMLEPVETAQEGALA